MNLLKKMLGTIFLTVLAVQVLALPADAVGTSITGYTNKENATIVISVTDGPGEVITPIVDFPETAPQKDLSEQVRQEYVSVPLYYQTDYPQVMYGSGTIETSGCSITSMAMVATYLTGYEYLPDELAAYFGGEANNNIARLEHAAEMMELPYEKPENWHITLAALKEGKIAIVLMDSESIFTDSQHFIVLRGMTEDGKILVNDPYAPNYDKWNLKKGFETGFTEADICRGYEGAWVFDKTEMPEEIQRYLETRPDQENTRYPDISLSLAEKQLLARVVWVESRGETPEGQQAVAEVVLNRMLSDKFPETLKNVIFAQGQFRSVPYLEDAEPTQMQYDAIDNALYGPNILPEDVYYFATYPTNSNVWGSIGGHIFCYAHDKKLE